jgi:hypothetical protein
MTDLIRDHHMKKKTVFLFPLEFHIAKELNNGIEIIVMTKLAKTVIELFSVFLHTYISLPYDLFFAWNKSTILE